MLNPHIFGSWLGIVGRDRSKPLGHIPTLTSPDQAMFEAWADTLVVSWDMKSSTSKVMDEKATPDPSWLAQSDLLFELLALIRQFPPDLVTATGDGFFLMFNLGDRFPNSSDKYEAAKGIINLLVAYQTVRANRRPHRNPKTRTVNLGGALILNDSDMVDGRFGVTRGPIEVRFCGGNPQIGAWLAPVGRTIFMAARLQQAAPDFGLLIDAEGLLSAFEPELPQNNLAKSKEQVELKGVAKPQSVWRVAVVLGVPT
ncbi:MAG: hypothetical protein AAB074_00760 [Planctomycetota bacterium]